jgi:hypothetical protein
MEYAWKAMELDANRLEVPYSILREARQKNKFSLQVLAMGELCRNRMVHESWLFAETHIYDYAFDDELGIIAYHTGDYEVSKMASERALRRCPENDKARIQANVAFAVSKLKS